MNITQNQYWAEVTSLAACVVSEAANYTDCNTTDTFDRDTVLEKIHDTVLHETIDGHQWVIYYAYNLDVLQYSDNTEYGLDQGLIDAAESIKQGLDTLHMHLSFWALYADVMDHIDSALDEYENSLQSGAERSPMLHHLTIIHTIADNV